MDSKHLRTSPHYVSCQERYNLLERQLDDALMPVIETYGLGLIPFSPLCNGLLTGKYRRNLPMPDGARLTTTPRIAERYLTDANWEQVERLAGFCEARGTACCSWRSAGCCGGRGWPASSPARRRRSRSPPMSAPPNSCRRQKTWTKSTG